MWDRLPLLFWVRRSLPSQGGHWNITLPTRPGMRPHHPHQKFHCDNGLCSVSEYNIITVIRGECLQVGTTIILFAPYDTGTLSIWSSGAMATHIVDVPEQTLTAIGRWRPLGFMLYIQQQILSFSTGSLSRWSSKLGFGRSEHPASHQSKHTPTFTHHPIPDSSDGPSNTPLVTAQPKLHLIARSHHYPSFQPKLLQNYGAGVHSKSPTKNWSI